MDISGEKTFQFSCYNCMKHENEHVSICYTAKSVIFITPIVFSRGSCFLFISFCFSFVYCLSKTIG